MKKVRHDSLRGGEVFGRLTVIELSHISRRKDGTVRGRVMRCKCQCGVFVRVETANLKSGNTLSCGCLRTENTIKSNIAREWHKAVAVQS